MSIITLCSVCAVIIALSDLIGQLDVPIISSETSEKAIECLCLIAIFIL